MLHDFRARLDPTKPRRIHEQLLQPLLAGTSRFAKTVAVIDSTDLPVATQAYKKMLPGNTAPAERRWAVAAARTGSAGGSSATKSTPCGGGCGKLLPALSWHR
jgi:hypothetical protein